MSVSQSIDQASETFEPRAFGRYVLHAPIARGGMATIHVARLIGDDGFSRIVAAKRLHPQFTEDPEFVTMFRDEAEIASKIHHPNVVPVLDIVLAGEEVVLVQEYVHGVPLDRLFRASRAGKEPIPPRIVVGIMAGVLAGLHAAHETADEKGEPLGIIHRDVSPQNVMVTVDGIPRLLDFGIAKARSTAHVTRAGLLKGKIAYMAPEQVRSDDVSRAADIYACGVVLWELLALQRMHAGQGEAQILAAVLKGEISTITEALASTRATLPSDWWDLLTSLEPVVSKAVATEPCDRYATAVEMLGALVRVVPAASSIEIAEWVKSRCGDYLERRQQVLASNEDSWRSLSRIAAANGANEGPHSGVMRTRGEASVVAAPPLPGSSEAIPVLHVSSEPAEPRAGRFVPWAVAAASLLVSAALLGALGARRGPAESVPSPPQTQVQEAAPAIVAAPEMTVPTEAIAPAKSFLAVPMPAPKPARALPEPRPATGRRASPEPPPPVTHASVQPAQPTGVAPQASPPGKADCDPPFYFEGTKKIFKANCI